MSGGLLEFFLFNSKNIMNLIRRRQVIQQEILCFPYLKIGKNLEGSNVFHFLFLFLFL